MISLRLLAFVFAVALAGCAAVEGAGVHCCDPDTYIVDLVSGFSQESGDEFARIIAGGMAQDRSSKRAATITSYTTVDGQVTTKHEIYDLSEDTLLWTITDGTHCSLERHWRRNLGCVENFMHALSPTTYGEGASTVSVDNYGFNDSGDGYAYKSVVSVVRDGCLPFSNLDVVYEAGEHVSVSEYNYGNFRAEQPDDAKWFQVPSLCPQSLAKGEYYKENN